MAQTNESQEQVTVNVETLQPVTRTLMTIGALPTSYLISMTYEEQLLWLQNYLIKTVIPAINNNAEATQEVQNIVMALQDYINDYFNNLDVQEEINNKLEQMAQDGSLTTLIEDYVNPYIETQNQEISNFKTQVNNQIAGQNAQIQAVTSGSPLVASSVAQMTDTTRVYVNTTDGNWYYYNGTQWTIGGVYQSTGIAENSIYKYHLNKSICGTKFHYETETELRYPEIKFLLLNNFVMGDLTSIGLKARFTNNLDVKLGSGTFAVNFSATGFGQQFSFTDVFPNTPAPHGSVDIDSSKNATSQFTSVHPTHIGFKLDMGTNRLYNFDIENVEFYINGVKLEYGKDFIFDNTITTQTDMTNSFDYLVSNIQLNEVKENVNDLTENLENLEEEIPSQEEMDILKNYNTATKSNLLKIKCFGDSLTAQGYPAKLQNIINDNTQVTNNGYSGQCSGNVAFRQGGISLTLNSSVTIPADTTDVEIDISFTGFNFRADSPMPCSLGGIIGKWHSVYDGTTHTHHSYFKRDESGESKTIATGTKLISLQDNTIDMQIIWVGRNDIAFGGSTIVSGCLSAIESMVNHLTPDIKRYIILPITTSRGEYEDVGSYTSQWALINNINTQLSKLYSRNYCDIWNYLRTQAIYDMGITPTEDDLYNMAHGTIPVSLYSDGLHFTQATYQAISQYIYEYMCQKDWIR